MPRSRGKGMSLLRPYGTLDRLERPMPPRGQTADGGGTGLLILRRTAVNDGVMPRLLERSGDVQKIILNAAQRRIEDGIEKSDTHV